MRTARTERSSLLARRAALIVTTLVLLTANPSSASSSKRGPSASTRTEPSLGRPLDVRMTALWRAFESSDSALANGLFFPRSAYLRMKRGLLASPASDYTDRLMAFYRLDLAVYRQQVSSLPGRLVRIEVDRAASVWIAPGTCENLIGYWHLPGVRFVYARSGRLWSFGVASLISWRGVWYVVHLGPNPRARNVGALDAPASGPGAPGPLGGC